MRFFDDGAWGIVALVALACACGSKRVQSPEAKASADAMLRNLDGTPLGTPASAIEGLPPAGELRKLPTPRPVLGILPSETMYIVVDDVLTGAIWSMTKSQCDALATELSSRIGPPTAAIARAWEGTTLRINMLASKTGACMVQLASKEQFGPRVSPAATVAGRFAGAELGAKRSSFSGLELREKSGADEWYGPSSMAHEGIRLDRVSYRFRDEVLVNVSFDANEPAACQRLLGSLLETFGAKPRRTSNGIKDNKSYEWSFKEYTLKFNDFGSHCSGILFAGTF